MLPNFLIAALPYCESLFSMVAAALWIASAAIRAENRIADSPGDPLATIRAQSGWSALAAGAAGLAALAHVFKGL